MKHTIFQRWSFLLFAVLLVIGSILPAAAEEAPKKTVNDYWLTAVELKAVYTEQAPTIDGTVGEGEWDHAYTLVYDPNDETMKAFLEQYGGYKNNWPEGEKVTLRFLWNEEYLFILDSRVDKFAYYGTAADANGKGALPWSKSDGANFGIQPLESLCLDEVDGDIWQFYTSLADANAEPNGSVILRMCYPAVSNKQYTAIPDQTQVAAKLTDDGWQMEIAIPWSGFQQTLPCFRPTAGYKMGFRIGIGNQMEDGTQYWGNYTDRHGDFDLSKSNLDYGGYPVLALADKDGNVPAIDLTIPSTVALPDPDHPGTSDTGESDTEAPDTDTEPEAPTDTETREPSGETGRPAEKPAEGKPLNVPMIVVLAVLMIAAAAGGVAVILKLKKVWVRILAGVLAAAMVIGGGVGIFAAVRSSGNASQPSDAEQTEQTEGNTDPDAVISRVPSSLRFEGETVRFLVREVCKSEFNADYNGSIIDNAVYDRNGAVEARLGITLNYQVSDAEQDKGYLSKIRTSVLNGDPSSSYDVISAHAYYGAALAAEGLYYNLMSGDAENYISPELAWYNQSFVEETSVNGVLNFLVGDITLTATDRIVVSFFNEDELTTYGIQASELYETVEAGKWTLEYVRQLIADVYIDRTGDGQTTDDFYGLVFNNGAMCVDAMLMAAGIHITEKDDDGEISLAFNSTYCAEAFKALYEFIYQSSGMFRGSPADNTYYGEFTTYYSDSAFFKRNAMISFGMLESAKVFATDTSLHYGMLPLPKYSENQKTYATTPQDGYSIVSIPRNIDGRLALATATLEVMSEYTWRDVRPVYYNIAYKSRYASSASTAQLFDDIIDNISYNFGTLYSASLDNPTWKLRNQLAGTGGVTASYNLRGIYRVYGERIEQKLTDLLDAFAGE